MTAQDLIAAFGKRIGQDGLRFNDKKSLMILLDERTPVNIEAPDGANAIFVSSLLCHYPPDAERAALFEVLMEAHTFGVATYNCYFGTSRAAGKVILFRRFDLPDTAADSFVDGLASFLSVLEFWKGKVKEAGL